MVKIVKLAIIGLFSLSFIVLKYDFVYAYKNVDDVISWAKSNLGNHRWDWLCFVFCREAYGEGKIQGIGSAIDAWNYNGSIFGHRNTDWNAPKGALIFFKATSKNKNYGHIGISAGNGEMYHAWPHDGVTKTPFNVGGEYLGWRWPYEWTSDKPGSPTEHGFTSWEILHNFITCMTDGNCSKDFLENLVDEPLVDFVTRLFSADVFYQEPGYSYADYIDSVFGEGYVGRIMGTDFGGDTIDWPENPPPDDPNPYTGGDDIHITHCKISDYKEDDWEHDVDKTLRPGEKYTFELEGRVRNKCSHDLENVKIRYCFVERKKNFDVSLSDRMVIDTDEVDVDAGEKESKHTRRSKILFTSDQKKLIVSTDDRGREEITVTTRHIDEGRITLYFYLDVKTDGGGDRDVSSESKADEYVKATIRLELPEPEPKPGDVDNSRIVELVDAVSAIETLVGVPSDSSTRADVNGDGVIGLEEAIYVLQETVGLTP